MKKVTKEKIVIPAFGTPKAERSIVKSRNLFFIDSATAPSCLQFGLLRGPPAETAKAQI